MRMLDSMVALGIALLAAGCSQAGGSDAKPIPAANPGEPALASNAGDKQIPVAEIPAGVRQTALDIVGGGLEIREAELGSHSGCPVYRIHGSAKGRIYKLELTADGKIMSVESREKNQDDAGDED